MVNELQDNQSFDKPKLFIKGNNPNFSMPILPIFAAAITGLLPIESIKDVSLSSYDRTGPLTHEFGPFEHLKNSVIIPTLVYKFYSDPVTAQEIDDAMLYHMLNAVSLTASLIMIYQTIPTGNKTTFMGFNESISYKYITMATCLVHLLDSTYEIFKYYNTTTNPIVEEQVKNYLEDHFDLSLPLAGDAATTADIS